MWSGWKRRHWPTFILRPGLHLYGYDKKAKRFTTLLKVTRGRAFEYENKRQFTHTVNRLIGVDTHDNSEWLKAMQPSGFGVAFEYELVARIDIAFSEPQFPRLGWYQMPTKEARAALMDDPGGHEEGGKQYRVHLTYERSARLRAEAKSHWRNRRGRLTCHVCGFDFVERYGELGEDFIEMHHEVPVSQGIRTNSVESLIPLCANCHRMLHRDPQQVRTTQELRRMLQPRLRARRI
jgi:putative restriction endonuclease